MTVTTLLINTGHDNRAIDAAQLFAVLSQQLVGYGFTGACRITITGNQAVIEDDTGTYEVTFKSVRKRISHDEFITGQYDLV